MRTDGHRHRVAAGRNPNATPERDPTRGSASPAVGRQLRVAAGAWNEVFAPVE